MARAVAGPRYRLGVASRALAGIFGSYLLAAAAGLWLERLLPLPPRDAVLTAGMLFFLVYCGAVIWAFAARSAQRAWAGIAVPAVVLGAGLWLIPAGGP